MGRDKASLPFGSETLLQRVVRLVRTVADEVVLAAGAGQAVPAGLTVVRDPREGLGPLPALLGASSAIDAEYVFLVACDTPLLQPALIRLLLDRAQGWDACVPVVSGVLMTTCAVYRPSAVRAAAEPLLSEGRSSLRALLGGLQTRYLDEPTLRQADPHLLSFIPCNTPEEYRKALALAGFAVNDPLPPAV
jgi:molybdopterin-guanine dinucleotide biosynthesis protein A